MIKNRNMPAWDSRTLIELSGSYWKAGVLHAGVKLGIFTTIGKEPQTSEEIARRFGTDLKATATLLNALSAMGLLEKTEERYSNTPASAAYLSQDSA